jgi:DNA-binding GntR family transcriptional regulator
MLEAQMTTQHPIALSRTTVADDIKTLLRRMIMSGELEPGRLLRQDELATQLGASRTPLREALQRLAQDGLVSLGRRGATVVAISREDLIELYEMREALETMAAREVARKITPAQTDELEELLERVQASEGEDWVRLNREFHTRMYGITGKRQLTELIGSLSARADVYVRMLAGSMKRRMDADVEHDDILLALRANDEGAAARMVVEHLRSTVQSALSEVLNQPTTEQGETDAHRQR